MVEVIGILASVIVLCSFLFRGVKSIRMVNIIGATVFVVYGVLLGSISVVFLNAALIIVHIYYLRKK